MIEGLKKLFHEENETMIYYGEKMFNDGLMIEECTAYLGENDIQTWITVIHLNKIDAIELDATTCDMYIGELLSPIQVYRIVSDIFELYKKNTIGDFITIINEMCVQRQSSSIQNNIKNGEDVRLRIREKFQFVKDNI